MSPSLPPASVTDHRHRGNSGNNRQLTEHQTSITTPPRPDHVRGNTARLGEPPAPAQEGQNGVRVQVLQPDVQQALFAANTRAQPHAGGQLPVRDVLQVVQAAGQPATTQVSVEIALNLASIACMLSYYYHYRIWCIQQYILYCRVHCYTVYSTIILLLYYYYYYYYHYYYYNICYISLYTITTSTLYKYII